MFKNYIQFFFLSVSVVVLTGFMCCCKTQDCEHTTCGAGAPSTTDHDDQEFGNDINIEELEEDPDFADK